MCDYEYRVDCKGIPLIPAPEEPIDEEGNGQEENTIDEQGQEGQQEAGEQEQELGGQQQELGGQQEQQQEQQPGQVQAPPPGLPSGGYPSPSLPRFPTSKSS